jgi:uncharacterized protein with von Willebrand factor type A (vWA) domain
MMKKLLKKQEENKKVTVVETDGIDALMFDVIRDAKKISEICTDDNSEGVVQDAFTSFFSHEPKIVEESPDMVQSGVIEQMYALPEYTDLRAGTKNDEISSALAAAQFAPEMIQKIIELRKKKKEQDEQNQKDGKPEAKSLKEMLSEGEMSALRQALRRNLEKAQKEADDYGNAAAGWGMDTSELKNIPVDKKMELAELLSKEKKMKRISDLAGRFRNIVNATNANVPIHGLDEVVEVGMSNDIAHMLPTEMIKLTENEDQFFMDYFEGKLLTYSLKGVQQVGQGPIICCLDMSGSMQGQRDEWGKAVVIALMHLAQKQNRAFGYVGFDTEVKIAKYYPKGTKISIEDKIEIATVFSGGGTEFYSPLIKAFEFRAMDAALKPADIIFITDGECGLHDTQLATILENKKKTDMRIYSVAIDCYQTTSLEHFSDQVAGISLNGDIAIDLVKDLISKTASKRAVGA